MSGTGSVDAKLMGQPIRALLDTGYIQIDFPPSIIHAGTNVIGGQVVWVINNRKTLKFDVPSQKTDSTHIFIRDLSQGFEGLRNELMQPSPTPATATSPH
jgi:hypothetical protein